MRETRADRARERDRQIVREREGRKRLWERERVENDCGRERKSQRVREREIYGERDRERLWISGTAS